VLTTFFRDFVTFALPVAYDAIDWDRAPEPRAQELPPIAPTAATGRRVVDWLPGRRRGASRGEPRRS